MNKTDGHRTVSPKALSISRENCGKRRAFDWAEVDGYSLLMPERIFRESCILLINLDSTIWTFWFQSNSLGSGSLGDKRLVQEPIPALAAINDLHNGDGKATVNKALQTVDTSEETERPPRNETPKRHIITRAMVHNWTATKLTVSLHFWRALRLSENFLCHHAVCVSSPPTWGSKLLCEKDLHNKLVLTPNSSLATTCCVPSDR